MPTGSDAAMTPNSAVRGTKAASDTSAPLAKPSATRPTTSGRKDCAPRSPRPSRSRSAPDLQLADAPGLRREREERADVHAAELLLHLVDRAAAGGEPPRRPEEGQ